MCGMDKLDLMLIVILSINFGYLLSGAILMCGGKRKMNQQSAKRENNAMRFNRKYFEFGLYAGIIKSVQRL